MVPVEVISEFKNQECRTRGGELKIHGNVFHNMNLPNSMVWNLPECIDLPDISHISYILKESGV